MNDTMEKTSSSLAIVEKKPHRTGGCTGIFFQLFDWNRRFAKKKLFPKKLLPPVRLRDQNSDKSGLDEKQAKLRLIADENCGGFPNVKKNSGFSGAEFQRKCEMRAPSLVARLMGLESIPSLQRQRSKKVRGPVAANNASDVPVDTIFACPGEDVNANKSKARLQKVQKTSFSERLPVATIGVETLQFKNILSRSRRHHPKLPSPVKSPINGSKKNASKLIEAASRILEPGLHTSRSKSALTYVNASGRHPQRCEPTSEKLVDVLPNDLEDPETYASVALMGHPSCPNCGHSIHNLCCNELSAIEQPSLLDSTVPVHLEHPCPGSEQGNIAEHMFYRGLKEFPDDRPPVITLSADYERPCIKHKSEKCSFSGRGSETPMDLADASFSSKLKNQSANHVHARNSSSARSKFKTLASGPTRPSPSVGMDGRKFETDRRFRNGDNYYDLQGRKRNAISEFNRQTYSIPHATSVRESGCIAKQSGHRSSKSGMLGSQDRSQVDNKTLSCTLNSPLKQKPGGLSITKSRGQNNLVSDGVSHKSGLARFEKPFSLSGDALGILLEQKLKELTSQGEDGGSNAHQKTTATVLQELISALTSVAPFQPRKLASSNTSGSFQVINALEVKSSSVDQPMDSEHPSPGSVLETYSSDASCFSSSFSDTCRYQKLLESVSCFTEAPLNRDIERLNNPCSTNTAKNYKQLVSDIISNVSEILHFMHLANCGLEGTKLDHAKDVLLNAELISGHAAPPTLATRRNFTLKHLLVEELETLATVLWINFGSSLGVESSKEANQLRRFALDSIIEYLDTSFEGCPSPRSTLSRKLPLSTNTNASILEVVEEVRKWEELSRFVFDELVEWEMTLSRRKWTRFEDDRFKTAMEISNHIVHVLVDEFVMDF